MFSSAMKRMNFTKSDRSLQGEWDESTNPFAALCFTLLGSRGCQVHHDLSEHLFQNVVPLSKCISGLTAIHRDLIKEFISIDKH